MNLSWRHWLVAYVALAAMHGANLLLPGPGFSLGTQIALFVTNGYVLYCALTVLRRDTRWHLGLFVAGYVVLFLLTVVLLDRTALFILLIIGFASAFGSPVMLGAFAIFVLSFVVLQPFAFESFIPLILGYAVVWRLRQRVSRFVLWCMGGGLLGLALLLFPLLHLVLQDSPQTLWLTLARTDVRAALWLSLLSSTIATVVITLWGVPLAYAMSRSRFAGKRVVESLIDVPILVPQSVVGVAFLVVLGPGSALGQALDDLLGLQISGQLLGIVLAQLFVAAPFLIKTAMTAFEGVPVVLEQASRTLGASARATFWRVSLPLASRGILIGVALAWARAISEFGAIVLFASSPVSAPVLVHTEFLRAGVSESRPIATLLLLVCAWAFVMLQFGQTLMPFAWQRRDDGAGATDRGQP